MRTLGCLVLAPGTSLRGQPGLANPNHCVLCRGASRHYRMDTRADSPRSIDPVAAGDIPRHHRFSGGQRGTQGCWLERARHPSVVICRRPIKLERSRRGSWMTCEGHSACWASRNWGGKRRPSHEIQPGYHSKPILRARWTTPHWAEGQWLSLSAWSPSTASQRELRTIVASLKPDSTLWADR